MEIVPREGLFEIYMCRGQKSVGKYCLLKYELIGGNRVKSFIISGICFRHTFNIFLLLLDLTHKIMIFFVFVYFMFDCINGLV